MKPNLSLASLMMVLCMPSMVFAFSEPLPEEPSPVPAAIHTVRPGDCFDKIARANGCSIADLAAANGLPTDAILQLGQQLKLPHMPASSATPTTADIASVNQDSPPSNPIAAPTHTIQAGDTYTKIAKQYKVSIDSLITANPTLKPNALRPGQKILLPDSGKTVVQIMPEEPGNSVMTTDTEIGKESNPPSAADDTTNETVSITFNEANDINTSLPQPTARTIATDREMTYGELAALHGTETERLNSLNGLDLLPSAVVVKGADLLVPIGVGH